MSVLYKPRPTSEIVEARGAHYEIVQVIGYSFDGDALTLDVDNMRPYDRQYRVSWSPNSDALEVIGHCAPGSEAPLDTSELPAAEAYDLMRWLETSHEVASERATRFDAVLSEAV